MMKEKGREEKESDNKRTEKGEKFRNRTKNAKKIGRYYDLQIYIYIN